MSAPALSADAVLAKYWNGKLPVDVLGIAKNMGVRVVAFDFQDDTIVETGLARGQPVIRLSKTTLEEKGPRARFAVAHALGHVALHRSSLQELST